MALHTCKQESKNKPEQTLVDKAVLLGIHLAKEFNQLLSKDSKLLQKP